MSNFFSRAAKAVSVTPPVAGRQIVVAGNTTAVLVKLPPHWVTEGGYIKISAQGVNVGVLVGDSSVVANIAAVSTVSGGIVTAPGTGTCDYIASGSQEPYNLDELFVAGQTGRQRPEVYVSLHGDADAGTVRIIHSSGQRGI